MVAILSRIKTTRGTRRRFTDAEKRHMWHEFKVAKQSGIRGAVTALTRKWGCNQSYIHRLKNRIDERNTVHNKKRTGRPTVMTAKVNEKFGAKRVLWHIPRDSEGNCRGP